MSGDSGRRKKQERRAKRKQKNARRRVSKSQVPATEMIVEYYQPAFTKYHRKISQEQLLTLAFSRKRDSFWRIVPPGRYPPLSGQAYVNQYLASVSDLLIVAQRRKPYISKPASAKKD